MGFKRKMLELSETLVLTNVHTFGLLVRESISNLRKLTWDKDCIERIDQASRALSLEENLETCNKLLVKMSVNLTQLNENLQDSAKESNNLKVVTLAAECVNIENMITKMLEIKGMMCD